MYGNLNLENFLNGIGTGTFFGDYWAKNFIKYNSGFTPPFSQDDFANILFNGNLHYPDLQCFDDKGEIAVCTYFSKTTKFQQVDKLKLSHFLNEGYTIRISNLGKYHKIIDEWSTSLESVFGCQIHINAYLNSKNFDGLAAHYDPHHIFAIQLAGAKQWQLGEIVINNPSHDFMPAIEGEIDVPHSIVLEPGDVLYLPPGLWHKASTIGQSLHITVGLHPPRWIDCINTFTRAIAERHPIFRADLPFEAGQSGCEYRLDRKDLANLLSFMKSEIAQFAPMLQESINRKVENNIPIASSETILYLSDDIWNSLRKPIALYLRGSSAENKGNYVPWDIDLYAIVEDGEDLNFQKTLCESMEKKYSKLPPIDISIMSLSTLQRSPKYILKRALLHHDSKLLKGKEIKSLIKKPIFNSDTAEKIKLIAGTFIEKYFIRQNWNSNVLDKMRTSDFNGYTKSLAKALVRSGTFVIIKNQKYFTRDIDTCYRALIEEYPDLEEHLSKMLEVIKSKSFYLDEFFDSATILFNRFYKT